VEKEDGTAKRRRQSGEEICYVSNFNRYYLDNSKITLDLTHFLSYCFKQWMGFIPSIEFNWRLPIMKLVLRLFVLSITVAGGAAAAASMTTPAFPSHQSATASMPGPVCGYGGHIPCEVSPSGR
jgi:hypothetical protein